ncbi:MAG: OmpA family protein [Nitrospirae bacterium]|nr:OmpA family protein [Nitrospirota bacterium]MBI5696112.1 OmpA family protein [Nitrospirota bacterium]
MNAIKLLLMSVVVLSLGVLGGCSSLCPPTAAPVEPVVQAPAAAPIKPAVVPAPVPKKQEAVCIRLNILFDFDDDKVKPEYNDEIKKVTDFLKANPTFKGTIEGGTDAVGDDEYNMDLSARRAENVKKVLVDNFGIAENRLDTVGFGKFNPTDTNLTDEGRAENRKAVRVYCSSGEDVPPQLQAKKCIILKVDFAVGSSRVEPTYDPSFKAVADYMKAYPDYVGSIEGYTDATGTDDVNIDLSIKRAESVKAYLVDNYGVPADRLLTVGLGKWRPIAANDTPEGRAQNRYAVQMICEPE